MSFSDKTLTCRDCGLNFIFTVGEQQFYAAKGFQHEPSRCPDCRSINRNVRGTGRAKELHEVVWVNAASPPRSPSRRLWAAPSIAATASTRSARRGGNGGRLRR